MAEKAHLTPLQDRFVDEYLVDFNASGAAKRAGSEANDLYQAGYGFLRNPHVRSEIDKRRHDYSKKIEVTHENVLREIRRMAFYDPIDLAGMGIHGPEDFAKLPEDVRRAIVGWSWDKAGNFTIKLADKSKALDQLAKYTGVMPDQPVNVTVNVREVIAEKLDGLADKGE